MSNNYQFTPEKYNKNILKINGLETVLNFGIYKNKTINDIIKNNDYSYLKYLIKSSVNSDLVNLIKYLFEEDDEFIYKYEKYHRDIIKHVKNSPFNLKEYYNHTFTHIIVNPIKIKYNDDAITPLFVYSRYKNFDVICNIIFTDYYIIEGATVYLVDNKNNRQINPKLKKLKLNVKTSKLYIDDYDNVCMNLFVEKFELID